MDSPASFTVNLPFQANAATPAWLGHPTLEQATFASLDLPIIPPDANASLLVTVVFQEKEGGFLRVTWKGPQAVQNLSDNFYEGIAMANRRSLLISAQTLQGPGTLNFQSGDTSLSIQRIKLEWVTSQSELVSSQLQDQLVTQANGQTQPAQNLNGQPAQQTDAAWQDHDVTVPITDKPQRIEQGVEFSVQLDGVPQAGRLALKEAGLPLGKHFVVWINQQRAGSITPAVPDLTDEGYLTGDSSPATYVGWREGSFYIPPSFLKAGVNAVQFSVEDDAPAKDGQASDPTAAPTFPLALKDVVLQLDYPSSPGAASTAAPATNAVPADATAPAAAPTVQPDATTPTGPISP